jgi:hypothetical protein
MQRTRMRHLATSATTTSGEWPRALSLFIVMRCGRRDVSASDLMPCWVFMQLRVQV